MKTAGIVLCGGQSRRMGKPKAWLPFAGELMLHRVVRILSGVVNPIVVVAAPEQEVPPLPEKITLLRDKVKGKGPLQGLAMGLEWLQGKAEAAYVSSCDVPFLRPAFMLRMVDLLGDHKICVPKIGDYHHPLAAVYRTEIIPVVERLIAEDRLRPFYLFQEVPTRIVEAGELNGIDPDFESLENLNTPEDYQQAIEKVK